MTSQLSKKSASSSHVSSPASAGPFDGIPADRQMRNSTGGSTYVKKEQECDNRDACDVQCGECQRAFAFHPYCVPQPDTTAFPPQSAWYCPSCLPRPLLGTCWIPLGDIPVEEGVLGILPGSAHLPNFDK